MEYGGKQLPFLDIQLNIGNDKLDTSVYRKPTYTSLVEFPSHMSPSVENRVTVYTTESCVYCMQYLV